MNNPPFTRMAVSLSGGGYRATTFHLGALSLLDAIDLEAGNSLIMDEERQGKKATLIENVHIISTISGGTLTGIMYALKLAQGGNFKDCYYKLYDLLSEDKLVEHALEKLNTPSTWKNQYKNRNLINAFAEVYDEHFYDGATFGDLYRDRHSHLKEVIFGASEFTAGLQYRFQQSSSGLFGADNLFIPKTVSERVRLADSAASSSCFPGGFEPMTMPNDFSNGPETRVEEWWVKKKINFDREATIALEKAAQARAAAETAIQREPILAESIRPILSAFVDATVAAKQAQLDADEAELKAHKAIYKAERAAKKAKEAAEKVNNAGSDSAIKEELETAAQKADAKAKKRTEKVQDKLRAAEEAKQAAQLAHENLPSLTNQAKQAKEKAPELARLLLASLWAQAEADRAVAAAAEATREAEQKAEKTRKKAEKKAKQATKDLELAAAELAATEGVTDRADALERAEQAAVQAEKSSAAAKKAAVLAAEASADLALIASEKVVEATTATQKAAAKALDATEKATALQKAIETAKDASEKARTAIATAQTAAQASETVRQEEKNDQKAASLAEDASAEVANHCTTEGYAAAYGKQSKKGGYGKGDYALKIPRKSHTKAAANTNDELETSVTLPATKTAVTAAEQTATAVKASLAALEKAAASLQDGGPAATKAIAHAISAATQAAAAAEEAEKKSTLARNDKAFHPTTAIMDGGILDNQGIRGVVMSEKRYSKNGEKPPYVGTYIISDVSGKTMSPYAVPAFKHNSFLDLFTLKRINILALVLFLGIVALLVFVNTSTLGAVIASIFLTVLVLWLVLFMVIRSFFRGQIKSTFAGDDLPEIMQDLKVLVNTPVYIILHLMKFRASSALKMITDIFLRRIRQLQIHGLYKSSNWNYRIVSNNIYELRGADKLTLGLKKVIEAANNMPTTLWFTQKEKDDGALDDLIACGQLTLCKSLIDYIKGFKNEESRHRERVWEQIPEHHAAIDAILTTLEAYWEKFRVDPYWLIQQYKEEREEHEAEEREEKLLAELLF